MSTNKHAVVRYEALDRCFSNFGRKFFVKDLLNACNEAIYNAYGEAGVQERQIYADIKFMESEEGYSIPLDRKKEGRKTYYRYCDKHFSIRNQPINTEEAEQLSNMIVLLKRFKGLPQFSWMDELLVRLEDTFNLNTHTSDVISFEENPYLVGFEHFTPLFNAIVNQQVLEIVYSCSFKGGSTYIFHPYLLKQYNNRWFLFGLSIKEGTAYFSNFALDRIKEMNVVSEPYIENKEIDFEDYFDDVVGVTVHHAPPNVIRLKVGRKVYNYIHTKPIHHSQKEKDKTDEYVIIELKLIPNYEFETLLLGFADDVEVLEPVSLREQIYKRAARVCEKNR